MAISGSAAAGGRAGLRIAHVDAGTSWRGGQQQLLLLARGLRRLGCDQVVVARPGEVSERLRADGFAVQAPGWRAWREVRHAAIAHAHDGRSHGWVIRARLRRRHGRVLSRRVAFPITGFGARWKYGQMDLILAVSETARQQVLRVGVPAERTLVIPDAVDFSELRLAARSRAKVRGQLGLEPSQPLLVCLSALTPEKGVDDAVAVMAHLGPECLLVLTGTGSERARLDRQIAALGLSERVRFAAGTYAPAEWVAAAEVLLMPSRQEGLGSAALVAMGLGVPVVATRAGGIPELIEDGVTGLLAPPGDVPALAWACDRILHDGAYAGKLAAAANHRARDHHDHIALAELTLHQYERLLGLRQRQRRRA